MRTFSIAEMELLTDIKMATLRMWEKRYRLFTPVRTNGGNRLYSIEDLKRVLKISLLLRKKFRISNLAALPMDQLTENLYLLNQKDIEFQQPLNDLIVAMYELNFETFSSILDRCLLTLEPEKVLQEIVLRLMKKTGLVWKGNRLTEEHFAVTIMRSKLIRCIEECTNTRKEKVKKVVLFLPDSEHLDLLLLFTQYQLKKNGLEVIYMGNDVTISNLETVIRLVCPQYIFTYLGQKTKFPIQSLSSLIEDLTPITKCLIVLDSDKVIENVIYPNTYVMNYDRALSVLMN